MFFEKLFVHFLPLVALWIALWLFCLFVIRFVCWCNFQPRFLVPVQALLLRLLSGTPVSLSDTIPLIHAPFLFFRTVLSQQVQDDLIFFDCNTRYCFALDMLRDV